MPAKILAVLFVTALPGVAAAQDAVSVERGLHISIIGGCHDCHTEGYNEANGQIDPAKALKGVPLGWRGPWGTTYAKNLRLVAANISEDEFVGFMKGLQTLPPMPWYNVRAMEENDIRSLFQYIKSLGEPGEAMPDVVPPDAEPTTPYITIAPPTMPKSG
jgi:mono/diheme cytochrome c family protein